MGYWILTLDTDQEITFQSQTIVLSIVVILIFFFCLSGTITCPINTDLCANKKCIMKYKFCDGKNDCGDNSDETDPRCQTSTTGL